MPVPAREYPLWAGKGRWVKEVGPRLRGRKAPLPGTTPCGLSRPRFVRTGFRAAGSWLCLESLFLPCGHAVLNLSQATVCFGRVIHSVTCEQDTHNMTPLG